MQRHKFGIQKWEEVPEPREQAGPGAVSELEWAELSSDENTGSEGCELADAEYAAGQEYAQEEELFVWAAVVEAEAVVAGAEPRAVG